MKNGPRRSRGRCPPGQPKPFERQNPKVILQQWDGMIGRKNPIIQRSLSAHGSCGARPRK